MREKTMTGIESFYNEKLFLEALDFAQTAHKGQLYGINEDYYTAHILKVVEELSGESYLVKIVGALHDVYEDTLVAREELINLFGYIVNLCVFKLTRQKSEEYFDYIRRIKQSNNSVCIKVKLADAHCNYKASVLKGFESKEKRYTKAMFILLGYN